ncbi:MAG: hypothetical protein GWN18_16870 [Thermoplasmata archaeon]|nr:hypothetical protein [Thermoplasmata archaeon]NIS13781.1 hypothetical protein [Thermoplasmata archaeon]NIS21632.1 hypothetical protein [Thermoplasmata archaeon]NIT79213.1 hypothetical protein [Thermoplasmata archaeon]NIU50662.1 hypothetical protein [Thermoplasmata archaeon]
MRVPWVPLRVLAVLLLLCLPAAGALGEGGVDPRVPSDLYGEDEFHPVVDFRNATLELDTSGELEVDVSYKGVLTGMAEFEAELTFEIYGWAMFSEEEPLSGEVPKFRFREGNDTVESLVYTTTAVLPKADQKETVTVEVEVPATTRTGYYRVSVTMTWEDDSSRAFSARSMGTYLPGQWEESVSRVRDGQPPIGADFLVSEAGISAVPEGFKEVSQPNRVPDFGNFSTPVIRPGESGRFGFTVTNRYDVPMTDVQVTIEFYRWATIEDTEPIEDIEGTPPKVRGEGAPGVTLDLGDIAVGGSEPVEIVIVTSEDTDKGTYFVRHHIEFGHDGTRFQMSSRGHFTWEQWEGFDYSNLYYQLGVSGIVPDSSFSVKDPVPLWPLATLIALCVLFGVLAVVFYLAEEHGDQYPRLKRGLQTITGRWEQRKRLLQQRMDELRREDRERDGTGEERGDGGKGSEE